MIGDERLPMSGGETVVTMISFFVAAALWGIWYFTPVSIARLASRGSERSGRGLLRLAPLIATLLVFAVLQTLAAHDVRDDWRYLAMYTILGAAWTSAALTLVPALGVSTIHDVYERSNPAAAWAIAGAIVALAVAFAGGNVGDGPGWWVVIFAALLSTVTLFLLWTAFEHWTAVSDSITVDRDEASGIRLAGFLLGTSLILARAAAGDWVSAGATIRDFLVISWPAIPLLLVAGFLERRAQPTPARPSQPLTTHGVIPALFYVAFGVIAVIVAGPPE
jgi:hypothetical protein